jgi:hypothetical protein
VVIVTVSNGDSTRIAACCESVLAVLQGLKATEDEERSAKPPP